MSRSAHAQIQIINLRFEYTRLYTGLMNLVRIRPRLEDNDLVRRAVIIMLEKLARVEAEINDLLAEQNQLKAG